jgi:hypothetical protein
MSILIPSLHSPLYLAGCLLPAVFRPKPFTHFSIRRTTPPAHMWIVFKTERATSCILQKHKSWATVNVLLLHYFYTQCPSAISQSFIISWNELSLFLVGMRQSLCYRPSYHIASISRIHLNPRSPNRFHFANTFKPAVAKSFPFREYI